MLRVASVVLVAAGICVSSAGAAPAPSWLVFPATPPGQHVDQLYRVKSSGDGLQQITAGPYSSDAPAFSPDGKRIAFARNGVGIITMNPDGTGIRRLTHGTRDSYPAWSPDGKRIAFVRPVGPQWRVYVMPATGGAQHQLHKAPPAGRPSWTTAGLLIPSGGDLLAIDDATGAVKKYYNANIDAVWGLSSVAVSPDVSQLTYVGARSPEPGDKECGEGPCQRFGLFFERLVGKSRKPHLIFKDTGPATFSPDGKRIVFAALGTLQVRVVATGKVTAIPIGAAAYPTDATPPAWR